MDGLRHAPSWNIKVEWWLEAYAPALEAPRNLKAGRRRGGPRRKGCGDRTGLWQTPPAFRRSPNYISRPRRHHTQSACCDCPTYLGFRVKRPASSSYSRRVDRGRERRLGASADGCITRGCSTGRRRRVDEPVLGGAQGVLASSGVRGAPHKPTGERGPCRSGWRGLSPISLVTSSLSGVSPDREDRLGQTQCL